MMNLTEALAAQAAKQAAKQAQHRGPVVFKAEIEGGNYEETFSVWEGLFSTAKKAEAAIAVAQAEIAPESAWSNEKYPHFSGEGYDYFASIVKVLVDEEEI